MRFQKRVLKIVFVLNIFSNPVSYLQYQLEPFAQFGRGQLNIHFCEIRSKSRMWFQRRNYLSVKVDGQMPKRRYCCNRHVFVYETNTSLYVVQPQFVRLNKIHTYAGSSV